jgi:hypothetical protein
MNRLEEGRNLKFDSGLAFASELHHSDLLFSCLKQVLNFAEMEKSNVSLIKAPDMCPKEIIRLLVRSLAALNNKIEG